MDYQFHEEEICFEENKKGRNQTECGNENDDNGDSMVCAPAFQQIDKRFEAEIHDIGDNERRQDEDECHADIND